MIDLTDRELEIRAAREHERATPEGRRRADFITGLVDARVFFATHSSAPIPDGTTLSFRVQGDGDSEREAFVDAIAEALGVHPQWRNCVYMARREFGPLAIEVHYTPVATQREIARRALHGKPVAA